MPSAAWRNGGERYDLLPLRTTSTALPSGDERWLAYGGAGAFAALSDALTPAEER